MSPTIPTAKSQPSTKLPPVKASLSKAKPKKMIANRGPTTNGALKVQQMLQGIEQQYSGITYTQSHGQKCVNRPTFIDWLSKHTELNHLIPQCIEIEEFERSGTSLLPAEEDESFSMSHLHHLQASFNSKATDMKEAADILSEYTKKATETGTVKNVANNVAPPTCPLPPTGIGAVAPTAVNPPPVGFNVSHHKRQRKPSAKALEAKQSI